jgi:hypothetical protein
MRRQNLFIKVALGYSVCLLFLSLTYDNARDEFTRLDVLVVNSLLAALYLFTYFLLLAFNKRAKPLFLKYLDTLNNLSLAMLSVVGIASLHMVFLIEFRKLGPIVQVLWLLILIYILFMVFSFFNEKRKLAVSAIIVLLSISVVNVSSTFDLIMTFDDKEQYELKYTKYQSGKVQFKKYPNVYFVSFDGLMPAEISQELLGVDSVPYSEVLENNFHQFDNFYANTIPTRPSLNSLLTLDTAYFAELPLTRKYSLFAGRTPSALYSIFKNNGYSTNALYRSYYFGPKGIYVDNYFMLNPNMGVCSFVFGKSAFFGYFGYCTFTNLWKSKFSKVSSSEHGKLSEIDYLITKMKEGLNKPTPQFFFAYVSLPGHAPWGDNSTHERNNYRKKYISGAIHTSENLMKLTSFITEHDPNSVLFVFGDHGPFLNSGKKDQDDRSYILDKYAVFGGIFQSGVCEKHFNGLVMNYSTPIDVASEIIKCLTEKDITNTDGGRHVYALDEFGNPRIFKYENYPYSYQSNKSEVTE